jgi:peptidoglycan/LPS O-acetylase OafA/YrhL
MDLVRAGAIVTVLIGHSLVFFHAHYEVLPLIFFAIFGVELFFALSGFLIGRILLEVADKGLDFRLLRTFWLKRWFRTIPAYLVVVLVTMAVTGRFDWSQLLFLQNYFPRQMETFPTSWSLTIEEWFYLLFPVLMLCLAQFARVRERPATLVLAAAFIFILGSWYLRYDAASTPSVAWDLGVRKQIPLRLDAIAFGVILAVWHQRRPAGFQGGYLSQIMTAVGVTGFVGCWWYFQRHIDIFTGVATVSNAAGFYPAISVASTALTASFIRFRNFPGGIPARLVYLTSLTSYSLYLVHLQIFDYLAERAQSAVLAWWWFLVAVVVMIAAGTTLYRLVEKPFMAMRRRFDPGEAVSTHFRRQTSP